MALLGLLVTAQGQNQRQIKGRVVLATDTLRPLPYVQVINRSNGNGTVSDLDGYYVMPVTEDDKIEFRMIGYHDTLLTVSQLRQLNYQFAMKERVVTLRPVTIRGQKQVYKPFAPPERKSDDPYVGYRSVKPSGLDPVDQKIGLATTGSGAALEGAITEFANLFSKKAKQRKKISALKERAREEEYYKALHDFWFDEEIVAELTGYKGRDLQDFIAFCNPTLKFMEEATEYQVILRIWHYQEQYEKMYYRDM
ncbi:hypothetical protein D770_11825 [Flammeovirgaceae bacterium 311]|nr:hypothetical protein D770_11825 [Flammeovirgaceae bacterium 311]